MKILRSLIALSKLQVTVIAKSAALGRSKNFSISCKFILHIAAYRGPFTDSDMEFNVIHDCTRVVKSFFRKKFCYCTICICLRFFFLRFLFLSYVGILCWRNIFNLYEIPNRKCFYASFEDNYLLYLRSCEKLMLDVCP